MTNPPLVAQPTEFAPTASSTVAATPTCCCCCCCLATTIGSGAAMAIIANAAADERQVTGLRRYVGTVLYGLAPISALLSIVLVVSVRISRDPVVVIMLAIATLLCVSLAGFAIVDGWQSAWAVDGLWYPVRFAILMFAELIAGAFLVFIYPVYFVVVGLLVWAFMAAAQRSVNRKRSAVQ